MKWRNTYGKRLDESKMYKNKEQRAVKKFAWIPHDVIGGHTVWLGHYYIHQKYCSTSMQWYNIVSSLHAGGY